MTLGRFIHVAIADFCFSRLCEYARQGNGAYLAMQIDSEMLVFDAVAEKIRQ